MPNSTTKILHEMRFLTIKPTKHPILLRYFTKLPKSTKNCVL